MCKMIIPVTSEHCRIESEPSRFLKIDPLDNRTAPVSAHSDRCGEVSIGGVADGTDLAAVLNESL